jgi:hypothetical protein
MTGLRVPAEGGTVVALASLRLAGRAKAPVPTQAVPTHAVPTHAVPTQAASCFFLRNCGLDFAMGQAGGNGIADVHATHVLQQLAL